MVFVVFALVALGGAAYAMTSMNFNYQSRASNTNVTATGKMVKRGTPEFAKCDELIRAKNLDAIAVVKYGLTDATTTAVTGGVDYSRTTVIPCLPLSIKAEFADPFIAKKVTVTGTYDRSIFFANKIRLFGVACNEQCPGTDGVLRNCTPPESDGTSQDSLCNSRGRVETCGASQYCCPSAGGRWTTDLSACRATARPRATPMPPTTN